MCQIYFYSRFCFVRAAHAPRCSSSFSPETHSFLHCICSCASLTHVSHLFKRYTHSCVILSLSPHISATQPGGLPDLFFSLTCIRPQNSWPDCLVVCALHSFTCYSHSCFTSFMYHICSCAAFSLSSHVSAT